MKVENISVYEHQNLKVGTNGFTKKHLDSLLRWQFKQQKSASQYFSLIGQGIKFKSWVGILQVGNLYIEILPKISNQNDSTDDVIQWRRRLCRMLSVTKTLDIRQTEKSSQGTFNHSLWEIFYKYYLLLVEDLVKTGLIKSYRKEEKNRTALKGKLNFSKQISKNLIHQEKFYTNSFVYDKDSLLNQIIIKGLRIISRHPSIIYEAKSLLECFEDIQDISTASIDWERVELFKRERKTEKYTSALIFAEMIIKGTNPNLSTGQYNVTGIMFDMNVLFEKYVAQTMMRFFPNKIYTQKASRIWETRLAIPDIVYKKNNQETIIFDTKWKKIITNIDVASQDIYQQYVYCKLYSANKAFLIYPWYNGIENNNLLLEEKITSEDIELFKTSPYRIKNENTSLGIIYWKWRD
ncbi:MAG: hypothetical protein J5978_07495 [Spirochaetaceae bacterium]|nr:hypothetical protein [Spirochaetaceae bacterium]